MERQRGIEKEYEKLSIATSTLLCMNLYRPFDYLLASLLLQDTSLYPVSFSPYKRKRKKETFALFHRDFGFFSFLFHNDPMHQNVKVLL